MRRSIQWRRLAPGLLALGALAGPVQAQNDVAIAAAPDAGDAIALSEAPPGAAGTVPRQRLEDAWWTGPLISNSPAVLPKGHGYVESYLYDVKSPNVDAFGSQTYMLYGLSDRFTFGLVPSFGYTHIDGGRGSTHVSVGDVTLHAQYALVTGAPEAGVPAVSIALQQSLPTGEYDRLDRESNGFGEGARTTTLALYAQRYFWMPNGRILRGRINVGAAYSNDVRVRGLSVYGTPEGFDGHARPGASVFASNAWEYSLTRNWVLAVDFYYRHRGRTTLRDRAGAWREAAQAVDLFAIAPAIEYNWSSRVGLIAGARFIAPWGHARRSTTPIVALSVFL